MNIGELATFRNGIATGDASASGTLSVNTITEFTSGSGVTINKTTTIGPTSSDAISHTVNGNLALGVSTGMNSARYRGIGNKSSSFLFDNSSSTTDVINAFAGVYFDGTDLKASQANKTAGFLLLSSRNSADSNTIFSISKLWDGDDSFAANANINTAVSLGSCNFAGTWTFGTVTSGRHSFAGSATGTSGIMLLKNEDTADASVSCLFQVGSAATGTANKLVNFAINAGGSAGGAINMNGTGTVAFGAYSDRRIKENIKSLPSQLDKILALNPIEFDYKSDSPTGPGHQIGFIAQEIENIYPDSVNYTGPETEEMKTVTGWDKTTAYLVKAIQEQQVIIESLTERIAALEVM